MKREKYGEGNNSLLKPYKHDLGLPGGNVMAWAVWMAMESD